ncbi:MAG TPA: acetyl-CoA carboxylase biotin carboxyl carrier protein subunit [Ruminococcaceae bacterium]|nr:acetyl-CoA carboxylase biotin carboxyl carrier protein subunit [Oscillospiraceae bacterium]
MKYVVTLNGKNYEVEVEETDAVITAVTDAAPAAPVAAAAPAAPAVAPAPAAAPAAAADGQKVLSPMPGTILSVNVSVGFAVKAGEVILILEAMKMENEIVAPCDGTVKQLAVQKGSTVATDALLAVVG